MKEGACGLVVCFVISAALAVPALAQNTADHLTCYKVKDPVKLKGTVDLDVTGAGLSAQCKISKAQMFCTPSDPRSLTDALGTVVSSDGPRTAGERVCYKVKCPAPFPAAQQVTDEFGSRTFDKFKTSMLCGPATRVAPVQQNGLDHTARGLAQLVEGGTPDSPSLHVLSLDGLPPTQADSTKSTSGEPGGGGVVVVLQAVSGYGVGVRDGLNSRASLDAAALRVGAVLDVRGHSTEASESMMDLRSVDVGSAGVSSTAYFPRLQRAQSPPARSGVVTCAGTEVGSHTETTSGDPDWTWFSPIWPDRYETSSNADSDQATFEWDNGCVQIRSPEGGGAIYVGDRLVISMPNGSNPRQLKRVAITGNGGLAGFSITGETTN